MKIALIQIDLVLGARILLSLLKEKGFNAKLLQINIKYTDSLSEEDLNIIYDYVSDSEVVGLSFNTFYAPIAELVAVYLKNKGIRHIIVGGNHATALPDEVIKYSDIVIKFEAEKSLTRVLDALNDKSKLSNIQGIVYKDDNKIFHSDSSPEIEWDLDKIPFQSVDTDLIKFFDLKKKLYTPQKAKLFPSMYNCYFILASRGCPFSCTYCSVTLYKSLDKDFNKVRKMSINRIIEEMKYALKNGFESFYIADDNFFSFNLEKIDIFCREYKRRIRVPFSVVGLNPNNFRSPVAEKKLRLLLDSGLTGVRIGVQSGSNKTLNIFKRGYKAEEVVKLLEPLDRNRKTIWDPPYDKLHIAVDFICDSVWESDEDKIATIRLAQRLLKQFTIFFYTLVYLPGTEIFYQAVERNMIDNNAKDIYMKGIAGVEDNIFNRTLFLIAITKEREVNLSEKLVDHILDLANSNSKLAEDIIDSVIECIKGIEKHHNINLSRVSIHPYLTGFHGYTKTRGDIGKKVLFRSYHEPYG